MQRRIGAVAYLTDQHREFYPQLPFAYRQRQLMVRKLGWCSLFENQPPLLFSL
jgi:hypothetical protein